MSKKNSMFVNSRRNTFTSTREKVDDMNTPEGYLNNISIGMNFESSGGSKKVGKDEFETGLMAIKKAMSGKYMSCVVVKLLDDKIKTIYSKIPKEPVQELVRCYRAGKKIFEMPLSNFYYILTYDFSQENSVHRHVSDYNRLHT